ncbi:MAG: SWIM zinc finger family protein [Clostridiales bacterium]|nr:SWIM zinc finger family protein [Candidatus Cacconaster stercorequi]
MKSILGFGISSAPISPKTPQVAEVHPVRSLVSVSFQDITKHYTYYNDRFDLSVGDRVYVSGKLAGRMGIVASVNTKFKINLSDYEKVVANPKITFHGTYRHVVDKMVACGDAGVDADTFRGWVTPPVPEGQEPPQIVMGEGYCLPLDGFQQSDDVDMKIVERALEYCQEGRVRYLSVQNGVGTAFVEGTCWYEVNFRFDGATVSELYCGCPYPGLCKHAIAVLMTLRVLLNNMDAENFTAVDREFFLNTVIAGKQDITLS